MYRARVLTWGAHGGSIRTRPPHWKSGSIKGLRLRGAITLKELTWDEKVAQAVLVSDKDQTITIIHPDGGKKSCELKAGKAEQIQF